MFFNYTASIENNKNRPVDSDRLNRWLTLIANLSVVAGIVFLAFELRQNNLLLEAQARSAAASFRLEHNGRLMESEIAAIVVKLRRGEVLNDVEAYRYERIVHGIFVSLEVAYGDFQAGLITELPVIGVRHTFQVNPGMKEIWVRRRDFYGADFVRFMEENVIPQTSE